MDMLLNPLDRRHRLRDDIPVVPGAFPWSDIFPPSYATCRACCGARNGRWAATSGWISALPDT